MTRELDDADVVDDLVRLANAVPEKVVQEVGRAIMRAEADGRFRGRLWSALVVMLVTFVDDREPLWIVVAIAAWAIASRTTYWALDHWVAREDARRRRQP